MGNAGAQYNLGLYYERGTGVAIDMPKAIKWYTLAADAGLVEAQVNLGACYDKGNGVAAQFNLATAI